MVELRNYAFNIQAINHIFPLRTKILSLNFKWQHTFNPKTGVSKCNWWSKIFHALQYYDVGLHSNKWKSTNITSLLTLANNSQRASSLKSWLTSFSLNDYPLSEALMLKYLIIRLCITPKKISAVPRAPSNPSNCLLALLFPPTPFIISSQLKIPDFSDDCGQRQSIGSLAFIFL